MFQYMINIYVLHICMSFIYLYTYVCTHTTHTHTHTRTHKKCTRMYTHYDTYTYKTIYVCVYVCIRVETNTQLICVFVWLHKYVFESQYRIQKIEGGFSVLRCQWSNPLTKLIFLWILLKQSHFSTTFNIHTQVAGLQFNPLLAAPYQLDAVFPAWCFKMILVITLHTEIYKLFVIS